MSLPYPTVKFTLCPIHAFLPKSARKAVSGDRHVRLFCARRELLIPPGEKPCCRAHLPWGLLARAEPPASLVQNETSPCPPRPGASRKDQGPALQKRCWRQRRSKLLLLTGSDPVPLSPISIPLTAGDPTGKGKRICSHSPNPLRFPSHAENFARTMADGEEEALACEPVPLSPRSLAQVSSVPDTKQQGHLFAQHAAEPGALKAGGRAGKSTKEKSPHGYRPRWHHPGARIHLRLCGLCEISSGKTEKNPRLAASTTPRVAPVTTSHLRFLAPEHWDTCFSSHVFARFPIVLPFFGLFPHFLCFRLLMPPHS